MAAPTINGTALLYVTDIRRTPVRAGRSAVAKSGKRHWLQQASRLATETLEITCEALTRAEATALKALAYDPMTTTPMTFADGQGLTWSVQCEEDSYQEAISMVASDGTPRYTVTLKLYQAT